MDVKDLPDLDTSIVGSFSISRFVEASLAYIVSIAVVITAYTH